MTAPFPQRSFRLRTTLIVLWTIFTVSLAIWWYVFSREILQDLSLVVGPDTPLFDVPRKLHMLRLEGAVLVGSLILGGLALGFLTWRDMRQSRRIRDFFLTFSHEVKTPLASVQLLAESLGEDSAESDTGPLVTRLIGETQRLGLQLENSLLLAEDRDRGLYIEKLSLRDIVQSACSSFPTLNVSVTGEDSLFADSRALHAITRNLLANAIHHGRATKVIIHHELHGSQSHITFTDNGDGFAGNRRRLGELFSRPGKTSGNGIGLHLVCELSRALGGAATFPASAPGFTVYLTLGGQRETTEP